MRSFSAWCVVVVFAVSTPATAGTIFTAPKKTRCITEDFERFAVPNGQAVAGIPTPLDTNTVWNGQGPGLVEEGVTFRTSTLVRTVQWNGTGYFGQPSKNLTVPAIGLWIDFDGAVSSVGFERYGFNTAPSRVTIFIYGPDDQTRIEVLHDVELAFGEFFGYEDPGGIGLVVIATTFGSTNIDNLEYCPLTSDPCGSMAVFRRSVTVEPSGAFMLAHFTPGRGCTLADVAKAFGYDHFNWLNVVVKDTFLSTPWTCGFFTAACLKLRDQHGNLPQVPYIDPLLGGYQFEVDQCAATTPAADFPIHDAFLWYWDEALVNPDCSPVGNLIGAHTLPTRLNFADAPRTLCTFDLGFETYLVGVSAQGQRGEIIASPGTHFRWEYITDLFKPDTVVVRTNIDPQLAGNGQAVFSEFLKPNDFDEERRARLNALEITVRQVGLMADAGPDQSVSEGAQVILDGSASAGMALRFQWEQLAGPAVALDVSDSAHPTFTAPLVAIGGETLTFQLVVVDEAGQTSESDTVDISVKNINNAPTADAGADFTSKAGATVTLDGSQSFDIDGDTIVEYTWTQVAGPFVNLDLTEPRHPRFTTPLAIGQTLVFVLAVSDGFEHSVPSTGNDSTSADTVAVTIVSNSVPVAKAGADQTKDEGSMITLDGSASLDSDNDPLQFFWTQREGTPVALDDATSSRPTFRAPTVMAGGEDLIFELTVFDNDPIQPLSGQDEITIHLNNINDPPRCDLAVAHPDRLWPPNHTMQPVQIQQVVDEDAVYRHVTLRITRVTQDEPVNGLGDGDTSPDAIIQSDDPANDRLFLRAERAGHGTGRVYVVHFTAVDGFESCHGSVTVSIPHHRELLAADNGQLFDSTQP